MTDIHGQHVYLSQCTTNNFLVPIIRAYVYLLISEPCSQVPCKAPCTLLFLLSHIVCHFSSLNSSGNYFNSRKKIQVQICVYMYALTHKPEEGAIYHSWANIRVLAKGFFSQAQSAMVVMTRTTSVRERLLPFNL